MAKNTECNPFSATIPFPISDGKLYEKNCEASFSLKFTRKCLLYVDILPL